ncbi:MAG TPA: MHYT domain-containing protein [Ramlibacter sp.]|jgi:NO-binding membrane sensor protein with MHYT domain
MNSAVTSSFQLSYVAISFMISVLGSFVALTAARRIRERNGGISLFNAGAAGLALGGVGVWAMHFIGMLALKLDVASSYSMVETGVSLVAAVLATSAALAFVAKAPNQLPRLLGAGFMLGMGVVVMHYLGMFGMRIGGYIRWDYGIVAISAVIAVVAATAALWLAFNTATLRLRGAASLLMGVAVCAMHYTGMMAAEFVCTTENRNAPPQGFGYVPSMDLYAVVAFVTLGMAALISIDQMFQWAGTQRGRVATGRAGAR